MADADSVGLRAIKRHKPQTAAAVAGATAKSDLHSMTQRLPITRDRDTLLRRVKQGSITPRKGICPAVTTFAVNQDCVNAVAVCFRAILIRS